MMHILCYGDSHTYGFDPHTFSRYPNPWPKQLRTYIPDAIVYEEGVNGRSIQYDDPYIPGKNGLRSLPHIIKNHPVVDVCIVMLGTNDLRLLFDTSMIEIEAGIKKMLSMILNAYPHATILLVSPPPLHPSVHTSMWRDDFDESRYRMSLQFASVYKRISEQLDCCFLDAGSVVSVDAYDGVHMNQQGHDVLAKTIAALLER